MPSPRDSSAIPTPLTRLGTFGTVALDDIVGAPMSNRFEAKFAAALDAMDRILEACHRARYRVLEVARCPIQRITTAYFDTPGLAYYHAHLRDRAVRTKVRTRHYDATGACFVEVKLRQNTGRTFKHRTPVDADAGPHHSASQLLPDEARAAIQAVASEPVVRTRFNRITLVDEAAEERVTLDTGVELQAHGGSLFFAGVIFVEVKQHRPRPPAFHRAMQAPRLRESPMSKYCLGVALLHPRVKHNRFKPQLRALTALHTLGDRSLAGDVVR